jgi:hypothetical protein
MLKERKSPGRRRLLRLPSPAIVIAMIALLVAMGGTAYGVSASKPAHYPEFNGVDIIDHTLSGVDIKNGSLGPVVLSSRARKALKGNLGPAGPQGPQGTQGVQGPAGAAGPPGLSRLIYRARGPLVNTRNSLEYAYVLCDSGYYAVGGGANTDSVAQVVNASYPGDSTATASSAGWVTWVFNTSTTAEHNVTAYVICAPAASVGKMSTGGNAGKVGTSATAMKPLAK